MWCWQNFNFFQDNFKKKLGIDFNKRYQKFIPKNMFLNMNLEK